MEGKYVIVRSYGAGVFAGNLESENKREVVLTDARRLWYWSGASSLSVLAMKGTANPDSCKFPCAVNRVKIKEVIEILETTKDAEISIKGVKEWKQH